MNIRKRLKSEAEKDYKKFSASLIPNIDNVLGVRIPVLRKIAKEIYKYEDWQKFIACDDCEYMEERMLQGMIVGFIKDEPQNILKIVKDFVPKIDNWSVCDTFCCGLKFCKQNKELVWNFIQPYFNSDKEFELRFAYVMLLAHFIDDEYIDKALDVIDSFRDEQYYSEMAVAWALSVCFVKYPDKTFKYLKKSNLNKWTLKKAVQKIRESYRVDAKNKELLKNL